LSLDQTSEMTSTDREALAKAVQSLEYASLAARLMNLVCKPVELIGYATPWFASKAIAVTSRGLEAALKVALRTLPRSPRAGSAQLHRVIATASGAAGATFSLIALPLELPVYTAWHGGSVGSHHSGSPNHADSGRKTLIVPPEIVGSLANPNMVAKISSAGLRNWGKRSWSGMNECKSEKVRSVQGYRQHRVRRSRNLPFIATFLSNAME
jgi:hypothetical protein